MMESASSEPPDDGRFSSQYLNHTKENPDTVILETRDDFFTEKEPLTKLSRGIFLSDKIIDHGKQMDNLES